MGDVGSAFCGFLLAVLPMALPEARVPVAVPVAAAALWPFIFDTAYTIVRRLRNGENVFQAHRSHLYQRLTIAVWSHRAVSRLYGGLSAMTATVAVTPLLDPSLRRTADAATATVVGLGMAALVVLVLTVERRAFLPAGPFRSA